MIYELFVFTGVVVWVILGLAAALTVGAAAKEAPGWGYFWILLTSVVVFGFTDFRLDVDLWGALTFLGTYLVAGAVYGAVRWVLLVKAIRRRLTDLQSTEAARKKSGKFVEHERTLASEFRADDYAIELPPRTSNFRSRTQTWIVFWPISLILWVIEDAILEWAGAFTNMVRNGLDGLTRFAWK